MLLRKLCLVLCVMSSSYLVSTPPKKKCTPTKIGITIPSKLRIVTPSKETELLWSYAEAGKAEAFIYAYIHKGGNLMLTNEYGETAVQVLLKKTLTRKKATL